MIAPHSAIWIRRSRRTVLLVLMAALLLPVTAKGPKGIEVSRYARVGVLVCRMANPSGLMSPITPDTDYGDQTPDKKHDVCGEDESRLKQAFPAFPVRSSTHVPKIESEFFGTLTQPLT